MSKSTGKKRIVEISEPKASGNKLAQASMQELYREMLLRLERFDEALVAFGQAGADEAAGRVDMADRPCPHGLARGGGSEC